MNLYSNKCNYKDCKNDSKIIYHDISEHKNERWNTLLINLCDKHYDKYLKLYEKEVVNGNNLNNINKDIKSIMKNIGWFVKGNV